LTYTSPRFETALETAGIDLESRKRIIEQVMQDGTCQHNPDIPKAIREIFVVSADISAEEHIRMQAALQVFIDNSLSKTINFPENATEDDVAQAYMLAWELGCKGITVYVTGSREKVVLETIATAAKKNIEDGKKSESNEQTQIWYENKKPRPRALKGYTYTIATPAGKAFVTINENGDDHPFEVFINTAKAGSETAAVSEAIGRLISYTLRLASPVAPRDRMREVIRQLSGIGGGRSLGFGPNRVRSLPDGVGQVLDEYLSETVDSEKLDGIKISGNGGHAVQQTLKIGDLCPECGEAAVVYEEGCRKCYACGFSEC
jgi:ribonucleoside-diphosphate reductase alpha chain